ncbi:hypothetical protein H6G89_18705 [Oscillatoria sp. FACHB-1407]|uniref:hypothetical protein n=1 Tax=Oscillatoria sp. FACHB-1407 TaxID=2692847 RepID=UPI0016879053|nr:hypothetical protein [Oscillatoria sp. FACHB-1407]MBD2463070.1 hypothetical protein [Oscillatoria sp. FACHB-1407]
MKPIEQLELPLWEMLQEATIAPDEADLQQLLNVLDESLLQLDVPGQLQVAAEAIAQIVALFQERSMLAFEELEATNSDEGPVMPHDAFDRYVRQTMEVDFEQFIEPLASLPRKPPERSGEVAPTGSVVGELDQVALLQALDEQMKEHPGLTEVEAFNQAMAIAHDEDVSNWIGAIATWMNERQTEVAPLMQIQQAMEMPLVQLWLALLLGGFALEQRGEFYETGQIWVLGRH